MHRVPVFDEFIAIYTDLRQKPLHRLSLVSVLLVLASGLESSARAQNSPAEGVQQKAANSDSSSALQFAVEASSRFGVLTYVPEQWGDLQLRLENRSDETRNVLCTSYFDQHPELQFGRQVWVPPRARLSVAHPIFFPEADRFPDETARVYSLVLDSAPGQEVAVKTDSGQVVHDRSLIVTPPGRHTGILAGWNAADAVPQDVLDVVIASRVKQALNSKVTILSGQFLPADETSLRYLDHLVIAEDRLLDDVAALSAVRRWLHAGGRLWIMLDRTNPLVLERLLGDEFHGTLIDHVGLTSVRIDLAPSLMFPEGIPGDVTEFEAPVTMARMAISGMDVSHTINGWPAALTKDYGAGRVLVTTVGPRAWVKPSPPPASSSTPPKPELASSFVPISAMEDLSAYVLGPRTPKPLPHEVLEPIAQEFIAYSVPRGALILSVMGVFLAALTGLGVWLWRGGRLEHFGWSGSLLAVLVGTLLISLGVANRHSVPATLASVQLVSALGGTDDVRSHGVIAVYRPEGSESAVTSRHGGELWPLQSTGDGATRRMVTTDFGKFHWDGVPQPAGLQLYPETTSQSFAERLEAQATIDDRGVVGRYIGHAAAPADAVLATRRGRMGVGLSDNGEFVARADDVLEPGQYLDATLLGDSQDRRRRIFEELFQNESWRNSLREPQLLLWLNEWQPGFEFGDGLTPQGETLLAVPVTMHRPPAGTEVVIPSPLIDFVTRRPPDGSAPAGFWDDASGEWQERSSPSTTWLSVQVPRGLLPLQVTQARLEIRVSGPMGRLEILGVEKDAAVSLEAVDNPMGIVVFDLDDAEALKISENGDLALGISAGGARSPASADDSPSLATTNYWRINSLTIQLWARTVNTAGED